MEIIFEILDILAQWVTKAISFFGYWGVFVLMALESANIPVPSEIIMPFAGFLAFKGEFSLFWVSLVGALGNLAGSVISYFLASFIIKNRLKIKFLRIIISDDLLKKANNYFLKYGSLSVFFSRLFPVLRTFISFPAGLGKMNFISFSILTFLGSFIWSFVLAYLGWFLGSNWEIIRVYFRKIDIFILILLFGFGLYWFIYHFGGKIKKQK
jgi:membrane protein DedA with SNARE-associated domain